MNARCPVCGQVRQVSVAVGACVDCLRQGQAEALSHTLATHRAARAAGLTRVRLGNRHLLGMG